MVYKTKKYKSTKIILVLIIIIAIILAYFYNQYRTSVFNSGREKITIGVYDDIPYIFSYSKKTNLAHVVYFKKEVYTNIPEEYGWYKLSGVNLLASIEKKQDQLIKNVFQELAGAYVDIVVYPKKGTVLTDKSNEEFVNYFLKHRKELFSSGKYKISTNNKFDRYLLRDKLLLKTNRLIVTNMENQFVKEANKKKYMPEKLDIQLKGYFYQDILTSSNFRLIIHTHRNDYVNSKRIARYIEGIGINVVDYVIEKNKIKECKFVVNDKSNELKLLKEYINCSMEIDEKLTNFVHLYVNADII
jgi:hypothetical protein